MTATSSPVGAHPGSTGDAAASPVASASAGLSAPQKRTRGDLLTSGSARFAFLGAWLLMILIFWSLSPHYMTWTTAKAVLSGEQALMFLGLALLCTLVIGEIDLSGPATLGLAATTVLVLVVLHGMNVVEASIIAIVAATLVGVVNAILIVGLGVSPFVVTLGMGTFVIGIALAISDLRSLEGLPRSFAKISTTQIGNLPIAFYYGAIGSLVFAYVLYRTPLGRQMRFIGANPAVARLAGVRVKRIRFITFVVAAFISGVGGVIMVAGLGGYNASSSNVFLLPVIASVFLSTAVFDPGKFNPLGVLVAVYFLRSGIVGLQILGVPEWVKNVFYGAALVVAVTASTLLHRRRSTA
jgi:ribose transport system permease protein